MDGREFDNFRSSFKIKARYFLGSAMRSRFGEQPKG
jgi:hypothetical protein